MKYYEVLVGDMQYHGESALTYSFETSIAVGSIVRVSLRARGVVGIIVAEVTKPSFAAKPIDALVPYQPLPLQSLQLLQWLRNYYPAPLGAITRLFVPPTGAFPKELPELSVQKVLSELPELTIDQTAALQQIRGSGSFLLHGITGSGKSRLYIELARRSLLTGRSSIILTPEIGLTAQLVTSFTTQFGKRVLVIHSQLTTAKRRDIWYQLLSATEPVIVIGPRSALFSPLQNIGLIVMDESHDQAYKNESAPNFLSSRVASTLASLHGATFVAGSATPNVEDYYVATVKERPIVRLDKLAKEHDYGEVKIQTIDMRNHNLFTRSRLFSDALLAAMAANLGRQEQTLLFLNRRGTANIVLCTNCGWQPNCPRCDLPLTYHGDIHKLRCHVCGWQETFPTSCPQCGNAEILLKSIGTKAVAAETERLFPQARVQRFDTDVSKHERIEHNFDSVLTGAVDILVGTQLLAKGLDLPRLSLVGIISADSGLFIPDYTAAEHTFQLVSQVAGRVGRGHRRGVVIVQSYDPENATIQTAAHSDWQTFYDTELAERKLFSFPPFVYLLKLNVLRATDKSASKAAHDFGAKLEQSVSGIRIEGPTPAFHPRQNGKYDWQIVIKSKRRQVLVDIVRALPSGWSYDIDPINLL